MKRKIAFVTATPMTATSFLLDFFKELSKENEVFLISSCNDDLVIEGVRVINVKIERKVSIFHDILALIRLVSIFKSYRFDIVHSVTPKAGLLSMVAATVAGIKARFHTFTGQVWVNKTGIKRLTLKIADKITASCASHILVDSNSQRNFIITEGIVTSSKSSVLAHGSISGVDTKRFSPSAEVRCSVRNELSIEESDFLFLYLGRVNSEKGIPELLKAFSLLQTRVAIKNSVKLLIVGPDEEQLLSEVFVDDVIILGSTGQPEKYMMAADLFCLPSHREGFGTVIIEAASCGIPSIGSNIYGIQDSILDGYSGLLHKVFDAEDICDKMFFFIDNNAALKSYSSQAKERAIKHFASSNLTQALISFYNTRL
ncbi:glycosyltransferase family 4 protein [Shewanella sp. 1CM18E]|uniref:glycosyltransferase family 4 protein n=1 Tax=Shewanella sp. 1CM18E TaxID=2929169 RepID=UPI0020BD9665|nr:glycosyltransferase family 4 protein [Shewanella sp. 1CM18E]MCK8043301.1 glycosyltransferase family 4 protein [Shewanella sp. 1CM18E]